MFSQIQTTVSVEGDFILLIQSGSGMVDAALGALHGSGELQVQILS